MISAESTELFVGPPDAPVQLARVTVGGCTEPSRLRVDGDGLTGAALVGAGQDVVEIPVAVDHPVIGQRRTARLHVADTTVPFAFTIAEPDLEAAAKALDDAGFTIERTPEDWLFKARADGAVVDVLHRINGVPVDAALIDSAELRDVLALHMPVLSPTQVLIQQLCSLTEHHCDFASLLPAVRAVREQVDWERVRTEAADNDFAVAFLVLVDRLEITA